MPLFPVALLTALALPYSFQGDGAVQDPNRAAGLPATAPVTYDLPIGGSPEFARLVLDVKRFTGSGNGSDRAKALRLAGLLPLRKPAIYWDDRKVPAGSRAGFRAARDYALSEWSRLLPNFAPRIVTDPKLAAGGLVFSFEPTLAREAGAAHFLATDTTLPRLETVIGLRRGGAYEGVMGPRSFTGEADVHNEVLYAMGRYLGLDPSPTFGGAMGRTDLRAGDGTSPNLVEAGVAARTLLLSDRLRAAAAKGTRLEPTAPRVWAERSEANLGAVGQGDLAEVRFSVANNGDAPLHLAIAGDCGCLGAAGPSSLAPGETGVVLARYDTSIIGGNIRHNVVIRTNDPATPRLTIPLDVYVRPPAHIILGSGDTYLLGSDRPLEMFVVGEEGKPLAVEGAEVLGIEGDLKIEPWRGKIEDPALKEGVKEREGYRLLFTPKPDVLKAPGRRGASLEVRLKGVEEPLRANLFFQRGIAAVPQSVSFGVLDSTPADAEFVLSRPDRPFKITGYGPLPAGVEVVHPPVGRASDRFVVLLRVRPDRLKGDLAGKIIIRTDDPEQPEIVVPVSATRPN